MSGFPPPPPPNNNQFRPPPPPPPPGRGSGGFAPPPPPPPPGGGRFAPPPPPGSQQAPPPLPGRSSGGFAPPPPPPGGSMNQLNQAMGAMSFQPPPPGGVPPPPGPFPPQGGSAGAPHALAGGPPPPKPGHFVQPQGSSAPPGMFKSMPGPPVPGVGAAPPPQPGGTGFAQPIPPPHPTQSFAGVPSQPQLVQQQQQPHGPGPAAPQPPGALTGQGAQQLYQEIIDYNIKIPERLFRLSCSKVPQTNVIATQSKVPLGGILRPLAPCSEDEEDVATVQPGGAGIIRCKRCRTYINALVHWVDHGRRWRCNICGLMNDTPAAYFCHLDDQGLRKDRFDRPELSKGVVEFVAPAEYMVRPPQEPTYFFVLDVSATAVRCGMLQSAAASIKRSLDDLPGGKRTKIGFITFDNSVHYYNLGPDLAQPQMLVVSDLKELFVPLPDNLLVNLAESRAVVDSLLDSLPEMFVKNPVVSQSCLGPALKAAFTVMKQIGGKMCVFQSIQPNLGDGALKPRENQSLMGSGAEVKLLRSEMPWYKDTAIEFSRQQISVDMFLFPYTYMDLSALGELPKLTSGSLNSYVTFNYEKDGPRFEEKLHKILTQETAFEAVMRIRCTKGMRITNFYGNFFIRGTDLMALPNVNSESIFGFDLAHDEQQIASNYVTIQAALLYTSSHGQRRIRVMTQALPVTTSTTDLINSVDVFATCNLLCKQAVDVTVKTTLDNARMRLQQICVDLIRAAKGGDKRMVSGYAVPQAPQQHDGDADSIPEALELFPLYTLAMMKNVAFRGGTDVHPDERVQAFANISQMWLKTSKPFIYPRLFSLSDMDGDVGYPTEEQPEDMPEDSVAGRSCIVLPKTLPLTVDSLSSNGVYLLDNGIEFHLWVGREVDQSSVSSLFGVPSLDNYDPSSLKLITEGDEFSSRVGAIITALREDEADPFYVSSKINIVREGDQLMESRFFWFMVEDRASFQGGTYSYEDFMHFVLNPGAGPGGPPGPAGPGAPRGIAPPPAQMQGRGMPPGAPSYGQGMPTPGPPAPIMPGPTGGYAPPPAGPTGQGPPQPPGPYGNPPPPQPPKASSMPPPPGRAVQHTNGTHLAPPPPPRPPAPIMPGPPAPPRPPPPPPRR